MSLPKKISTVVFTIHADGDPGTVISTHTITVSNLRHPWNMVMWEERQGLSITGKKRKKNIVRGFDSRLEFQWEDVRNQETEILALIDDLKVVADNDYQIKFNVSDDTNDLYVIPNEAVFNQDYVNQIKRTPTTISFELEQLQDDISYD